MARVLVDQLVGPLQRNQRRPGLGPGRRVGDGDLVVERVGADAGEALDQVQVLARSSELALLREIRRLDDQRVAFPAASRVAVPELDVLVHVRTAVHRDDARIVRHLAEEHHALRRLDDLVVVVVAGAHLRHAEVDAAFAEAAIFRIVLRLELSLFGGGHQPFARSRDERGQLAVLGIGQKRRAPVLDVPLDQPEVIVVAGSGVVRSRILDPIERGLDDAVPEHRVAAFLGHLGGEPLDLLDFRVGQVLLAFPLPGPFERSHAVVGPVPLQIRLAVRSAGHLPGRRVLRSRRSSLALDGNGGDGRHRHRDSQCCDGAEQMKAHLGTLSMVVV